MRAVLILFLALIVAAPVAAQEQSHTLKGAEMTPSVQVSLKNDLLNSATVDRAGRAMKDFRSEFQRGEFVINPLPSEPARMGGPSGTVIVVVVVVAVVVVVVAAMLVIDAALCNGPATCTL